MVINSRGRFKKDIGNNDPLWSTSNFGRIRDFSPASDLTVLRATRNKDSSTQLYSGTEVPRFSRTEVNLS